MKNVLYLSALLPVFSLSASTTHPLDPLTAVEISTARSIIAAGSSNPDATDFVYLSLSHPQKTAVLNWRPGDPLPRSAFFAIRENQTVSEGIIDLDAKAVVRRESIPGAQSRIIVRDYGRADDIIKNHPAWRKAMRKRGFESFDKIRNIHYSAGYWGSPEETGRRLLHAVSYDAREKTNFWGHPIEGVFIIIDLDSEEVVKLVPCNIYKFG